MGVFGKIAGALGGAVKGMASGGGAVGGAVSGASRGASEPKKNIVWAPDPKKKGLMNRGRALGGKR